MFDTKIYSKFGKSYDFDNCVGAEPRHFNGDWILLVIFRCISGTRKEIFLYAKLSAILSPNLENTRSKETLREILNYHNGIY